MKEKREGWYRNLTFSRKVLISHLAVSLIPVIILGLFCYSQTRRLLIRREREVLAETLEQSLGTLDSSLYTGAHVMENIIWDTQIKGALAVRYENNLEMYLAYRDIIDPSVKKMKSLYPQLERLTIYSGNPTLYPHGSILVPVSELEQKDGEFEDYRLHWEAGREGFLELYCRIYDSASVEKNVVYAELDYEAVFGYLSGLFGSHYGVLITDGTGGTVYSYAADREEELSAEDMEEGSHRLKDYVLEKRQVGANDWTMYLYRPLKAVSASAGSITVLIAITVLLCLGIILAASLVLTKSVVWPLGELIRNIEQIEEGNMSVEVMEESRRDEIGRLIHSFRSMMERLNHMVNEVYLSKIAQQKYEMRALQAQINPHFLYNALSLINWKAIMADQDEISQMAQLLSTFYRTTLNRGKNVISIEGEWENTCSYLRIQDMMHSGKYEIHTEIEEGISGYEMPNLILQPLVENALVHGLDCKTDSGARILRVIGRQEGEELVFTVTDNGCGIPEETLKTILLEGRKGYGVQNVHHRIQLYYGEEYGLHFESRVGEGTKVTLRIPKDGGQRENT